MKFLVRIPLMFVLVLGSSSACAAQNAQVNPHAAALTDFAARVDKYIAMRKAADAGAPALKETSDPAQITAAQDTLRQRLIAANKSAKHGDIFTPEISARFRSLLHPEVKDRSTKAIVADDNPGNFPYKVMAPYPDGEPYSTMPPNVLMSLPKLPDGIEYRFVGKHLILRDTRADLIIDYVANAIG